MNLGWITYKNFEVSLGNVPVRTIEAIIKDLPEDHVFAVEVGGGTIGDEELAAVGIGPGVGHGDDAFLGEVESVLEFELVVKAAEVSGGARAVLAGLKDKAREVGYAVKGAVGVEGIGPTVGVGGGVGDETCGGFTAPNLEDLEDDTAHGRAIAFDDVEAGVAIAAGGRCFDAGMVAGGGEGDAVAVCIVQLDAVGDGAGGRIDGQHVAGQSGDEVGRLGAGEQRAGDST